MDNNSLAIYIHELRNLCDHTVASLDIFNQAAQARNGKAILYAGQVVLMPVAQIASILWPSRARSRSRGEHLRKTLGLAEKHVLNDKRMTELLDRSDERLEDWISRTKGDQVVFDFVGNPADLKDNQGISVREDSIYRAFNPENRIYYYRGVGYNLQALAQAIADLNARVWAVYRQLFPEQAKAEEEARRRAMENAQKAQAESKAAEAQAVADAGKNTAVDTAADTGPQDAKPAAKKPAAKKAAPKKAVAKTTTKAPAAKKAAPKKAAPKKASAESAS